MGVNAATTTPPPPSWTRGVSLGLVASLVLHVALVAWVIARTELPDVGFTLSLPMDVELGMTEGVRVASSAPPSPPPPPSTPPPSGAHGEGASDGGVPSDASVDAGHRRRRPRDAGSDGAEELVASAEADAAVDAVGDRSGLAAYAPPGAQIALRLDMARIRSSPLAPDVRQLLAAIPDWQLLLEGSEIDPLADLDRLMIATPNLQRERLVMSGRWVGDDAKVRDAVARLAAARGVPAEWRRQRGIDVAPWANADETERVIALVGPSEFTITRPTDLPRILAIAHARRLERRQDGGPDPGDADALLAMGEGNALEIDIEGARRFVQGPTEDVPERLHVGVTQRADGGASVYASGTFETPERASASRDVWDRMRDRAARSPVLALVGLDTTLREATLTADGATLRFHAELGERELRLILAFLGSQLAQRAPLTPPPLPPP